MHHFPDEFQRFYLQIKQYKITFLIFQRKRPNQTPQKVISCNIIHSSPCRPIRNYSGFDVTQNFMQDEDGPFTFMFFRLLSSSFLCLSCRIASRRAFFLSNSAFLFVSDILTGNIPTPIDRNSHHQFTSCPPFLLQHPNYQFWWTWFQPGIRNILYCKVPLYNIRKIKFP